MKQDTKILNIILYNPDSRNKKNEKDEMLRKSGTPINAQN
jgi:hypothetical protein